jgi:hypothetical protein
LRETRCGALEQAASSRRISSENPSRRMKTRRA